MGVWVPAWPSVSGGGPRGASWTLGPGGDIWTIVTHVKKTMGQIKTGVISMEQNFGHNWYGYTFKVKSLRLVWYWEVNWRTLAASDTASQLPPVRLKWPLPILLKISFGVSSGPLANGVKLVKRKETENEFVRERERGENVFDSVWVHTHPASMVYSKTPKLQMSQPSS